MDENWKSIPGYEGLYEVSDLGRIRSLDRTVVMSNGYERPLKGRVLRHGMSTSGYEQVALRRNGETRSLGVHRLVCRAFHGPAPEGKPWVLHGDGDKTNNTADNLRWGTPKENTNDAREAGALRGGNAGATHCKQGHEFTEENTHVRKNGSRACKTCRRMRVAASRQRHRAEYQRRNREAYHARSPLEEGDPRHGTATGYNNWKCRCEPCKAAYKDYKKSLRLDNEQRAA